MNISLRNLKLVHVIVKEGSITKAADKLFLSQPAISHQLKKMEEEIGLKVFNRVNKKLILTETGQVIFNTSEKILASFIQLNNKIEEIKSGDKKVIRLSTECYTTYHWLPSAVQEFKKAHKNTSIEIVIEATKAPLQYLTEGKIDLAIVSDTIDHPSIYFEPLIQDEMVVVMSKENPLSKLTQIDFKDFSNQNLILYDLPEEKNYVLKHILHEQRAFINSIQKVQLTEAIIQLVRANLGVSIVAKWSLKPFLHEDQLKIIPIKHNKGVRTWYIASLNKISTLDTAFINEIKTVFNQK